MAGKKTRTHNIWGIVFICIGVILICGFIFVKTMETESERESAEQVLSTIKKKIEDVNRENAGLENEIKYRQTNDYYEDIARDKYGLVGADETYFKEGKAEDNNKAGTDGSEDKE